MVVTESISKQLVNFFLDSSIRWLTDLLPGHSRNAKSKYSQKLDRFFPLPDRHWYAALVRGTRVVEHTVAANA